MPGTTNNRLKILFDTAPVKIWTSDEYGNFSDFNRRWLEYRGVSREEEISEGWTAGVHPEDLPACLDLFRHSLVSQAPFQMQLRLKNSEGCYHVMVCKGEPVFEDNRHFSGFVGTCTRVQEPDPATEKRCSPLFEETASIARVGGWEFDTATREMSCTNELYRILEVEPGLRLTPECLLGIFRNTCREKASGYFNAAVQQGTGFDLELRALTSSGREIWVSFRAKPYLENNAVVRLIGSLQDITQQKEAEAALIESERKLHFVLDGLPVVVYLTDARGYITNYNKTAVELWGRNVPKDTIKWSGSHKLYSEDGTTLNDDECPMAVAITHNKVIHGEELISECSQGTRTNVIVFATPYTNDGGEVIGALNVLVDITERKLLEEKLITLSLVARKTSNAVIISDAEGRITWVNQSFTRVSGYSMEEAVGKTPEELLHCEETDKQTVKDVHKAIRKQEAVRFEILNKGKHGNKYWLDVDIQPLKDRTGRLSGFVSVETDITEIKYMHEELKKSENKLRAILDSTSDDNILVDTDYKIISINKVATQNLGKIYGLEPSVGQQIWTYVHEEMRPEFEQTFNQAVAGFMSKKERLFKVRGDVKMWFEFCFYPVYSRDGALIGVAINSKSIHAKKMAELRVQHQNRKLKEIAFIQSHTLRRPVANILGLWNLINQEARHAQKNPDLSQLLTYLGRSVQEMDEVIRDITDNTYNIGEV